MDQTNINQLKEKKCAIRDIRGAKGGPMFFSLELVEGGVQIPKIGRGGHRGSPHGPIFASQQKKFDGCASKHKQSMYHYENFIKHHLYKPAFVV